MSKRTVFSAFLAAVLLLAPPVSQARWMNPQTGRFHTMDTFEGNQEQPLSLHKYVYCQGNPASMTDPSGRDGTGTAPGILGVTGIIGHIARITLPAINAGRLSALNKVAQVAATAAAGYFAKTIVQDWVNKAKDKWRRLNPNKAIPKVVPVPEPLIPAVAEHIRWHQSVNPSHMFLTRGSIGVAAVQRAFIMAEQAWELVRESGLDPRAQLSWDEYPFASSEQGGKLGVTIWPVPLWENHLQGGIIMGSYYLENIKSGQEFAVVIVP